MRFARQARRAHIAVAVAVLVLSVPAVRTEAAATPAFTEVKAFATKTGSRLIIAWEADQPVTALVRYGTKPDRLVRHAQSLDVTADTAGFAMGDGMYGTGPWFARVEDTTTGATSAVVEVAPRNAYKSWDGATYTINLLVQLDTEGLPEDIPQDRALAELGAGINVLAERVYDAWDGYARLGTVLITERGGPWPWSLVGGPCATDSPADVMVLTTPPFMSTAYLYGIERPCATINLGRAGWLFASGWDDDLEFASVANHELGHYAFGTPDLYPTGGRTLAAAPVQLGPDCRNLDWDGSVMHNTGGWNALTDRWEMTEMDRNATQTPCRHGSNPYSWETARYNYRSIPAIAPIQHVIDDQARGNEDGGRLDIWILDRDPAGSSLRPFTPDDTLPVP